MAFVVENGTGLANATSLCGVATADGYFEDRLNAAWTGTDDQKAAALIRATDYVEGRFASSFKGEVQFPEVPQALSFPRLCIGYDGVVPPDVAYAVAEYAVRALAGPLAPDPTTDASGNAITAKKVKVGPIETSTEYVGSATKAFKAYPAADLLLAPFLRGAGGSRVYR